MGKQIKTLFNGMDTQGFKTVRWNGKNDKGELVSPGIYFCTLSTNNFTKSKKLIFLK